MAFDRNQILIAQLTKKSNKLEFALRKLVQTASDYFRERYNNGEDVPNDISYAIAYGHASLGSKELKQVQDMSPQFFINVIQELYERKFVKEDVYKTMTAEARKVAGVPRVSEQEPAQKPDTITFGWNNKVKELIYEKDGGLKDTVASEMRSAYDLTQKFPQKITTEDGVVLERGKSYRDKENTDLYYIEYVKVPKK